MRAFKYRIAFILLLDSVQLVESSVRTRSFVSRGHSYFYFKVSLTCPLPFKGVMIMTHLAKCFMCAYLTSISDLLLALCNCLCIPRLYQRFQTDHYWSISTCLPDFFLKVFIASQTLVKPNQPCILPDYFLKQARQILVFKSQINLVSFQTTFQR